MDSGIPILGTSNLEAQISYKYVKGTDISCEYFPFLAYQRSVQLLHEKLDTFIEALTAFTIKQS